jgi:hypothetical protein
MGNGFIVFFLQHSLAPKVLRVYAMGRKQAYFHLKLCNGNVSVGCTVLFVFAG